MPHILMNYGTMEEYFETEQPRSNKTIAVIVSALFTFLFLMFLSMYGTVYLLCQRNNAFTGIISTGLISSVITIVYLVVCWKYRYNEYSSNIFREQYCILLSDLMISTGLLFFLNRIEPGICYEIYFHIVKGLHILRYCFSLVMIFVCTYSFVQNYYHITENQNNNDTETV
jgi:hypothetical protein